MILSRGTVALTAVLIAHGAIASAQRIELRVVDAPAERPVAGALVSLIAESGAVLTERLTREDGTQLLIVPAPGTFRVRVRRIGFTSFTSDQFTVSAGETVPLTLRLSVVPIVLPQIVVNAERKACGSGEAVDLRTTPLWESIGTALTSTEVTRQDQLVRATVETFERTLDPNRRLISEKRQQLGVTGARPFSTPEPEVLTRTGYVVSERDGTAFYAPDARVLLSESFGTEHCFHWTAGAQTTAGLIGLAFQPVRNRRVAEISGTLWVDTASSELRYLDYRYENLFRDIVVDSLGGQIAFQRLPSGAWIVSHWVIRMPRMASERQGTKALSAMTRSILEGYLDVGGTARVTAAVAGATHARVVGTVYDSIAHRPLSGAFVTLMGTTLSGLADSLGAFRFDSVPPGTLTFAAEHAALDSIGFTGITRTVTLAAGSEFELGLATPTFRTLWSRACGEATEPARADTGFIYGAIRDATNRRSVANADIVVSWFDATWKSGDSVRSRTWQTTATSDSTGSYVVCGVPDSVALQLRASTSSSASGVIVVDPAGRRMIRRDLALGPLTVKVVRGGVITGTVSDTLGTPMRDARVVLDDSVEVRSNGRGRFSFRDVSPGSRQLVVLALGYAPRTIPVEVSSKDTAVVGAHLERLVTLPTVNTRDSLTAPRLTGFDERMRDHKHGNNNGYFITMADIAKRPTPETLNLFESIPGLQVHRNEKGKFVLMGLNECRMTVYLDGVRLNINDIRPTSGGPPARDRYGRTLNNLGVDPGEYVHPTQIAGIEVYRRGNEVPPQYMQLNGSCGVVLIWTRTHVP